MLSIRRAISLRHLIPWLCASLAVLGGSGLYGIDGAVLGGVFGYFFGKTLESFRHVAQTD